MSSPTPSTRRRWPIVLAVLGILLLVAYFVLTSSAVLRSLILPRAAAALNADVAIDDIALSPFSSLTLRQLKITPRGAETLVTVAEVRVRYSLLAILRGTLTVSEITLDTPAVTVVQHADGTSNLSTWLAAQPKSAAAPASSSTASSPPRLDVHNVSVKNGSFRQSSVPASAAPVLEISGVQFSVDQLVNGSPSKIALELAAKLVANANDQVAVQVKGSLGLNLSAALQPTSVKGSVDAQVQSATGSFKEFAKMATQLAVETTPTEIQQLKLTFLESGQAVGALSVKGPLDPARSEAHLVYALDGIDRRALGLVGAARGIDFGQTSVAAQGKIDVSQGGQAVASDGKLSVRQLSLKTSSGTTPVLDTALDYQFQLNLAAKTATLQKIDLTVQQGATPTVRGALDHPMTLGWASAVPGFQPATYTLTVQQFELAPWQSVAGTNLPSGRLNLRASVSSQRDGRQLSFNADGGLDAVATWVAGKLVRDLALAWKLNGTLEDFAKLDLERATADAKWSGQSLATFSATAKSDTRTHDLSADVQAELQLPTALKMSPVAGTELTAGQAQLKAQVLGKADRTTATANFGAVGLNGNVSGAVLKDYRAVGETALTMTGSRTVIDRGQLAFNAGRDAGGTVTFGGDFDSATKRGQFSLKTSDLNEKALAPFLNPAIAPQELRSALVDLATQLQFDLNAESTVKSTFKLTKWTTQAPGGKLTANPLELGLTLDATQRDRALTLRDFTLDLGKTPKASNRVKLVGNIDLTAPKPAPSVLTLTSDGLDLTPWYDLVSGTSDGTKPAPAPTPPASSTKPGTPIQLPIDQLTLDAKVAGLFLREVAISNLVTKLVVDHGKVNINPFALTLNGAPISAAVALDLSIPGYRYDISTDVGQVPVSPLAKSFFSRELVDLKGTVHGAAKFSGAGVDAVGLKQNLKGTMGFAATNLDYQISSLQTPLMRTVVATLSTVLQLPDISQSPLNTIGTQVEASQGVIALKSARVSSQAFAADATGQIQMADVWTNSALQIPLTVSLPKAGQWEALPQFLTIRGTVGSPKPDINALAAAQLLTKLPGGAGALANQGAAKLGSALDKALGGKGSTNPGAGTELIQGLLGGSKKTNAAAGGTNEPAKPLNPLDLFKKPKSP